MHGQRNPSRLQDGHGLTLRTEATRAELYAKGHKWPDLRLFDLSDLLEVGIDPAALEIGTETPCRFWAHYELREKLNGAGNPYKDVITLEPIDRPTTSTSTDTSALLGELRQIRAMLERLLELQPYDSPAATGDDAPVLRYANGSPVSDNPDERKAFRAHVATVKAIPASIDALREWA